LNTPTPEEMFVVFKEDIKHWLIRPTPEEILLPKIDEALN
jgi:hypothetical protein